MEKKEKRPVGRPRLGEKKMKSYHYKADYRLVPILEKLPNKNLFINTSVYEKALREGLIETEFDITKI